MTKWPIEKNEQLAKWLVEKNEQFILEKCYKNHIIKYDQLTKWPFDKMTVKNDHFTKWLVKND